MERTDSVSISAAIVVKFGSLDGCALLRALTVLGFGRWWRQGTITVKRISDIQGFDTLKEGNLHPKACLRNHMNQNSFTKLRTILLRGLYT